MQLVIHFLAKLSGFLLLDLVVLQDLLVLTLIANVLAPPLPPAQACLNSWSRYSSISVSLGSKSYTTTLTSTQIFSTFPAVPTSTFCDNIPRLLARQYSEYITQWYPTTAYTTWSSMTSPTPTCTVNEDECAKLKSTWDMLHGTETLVSEFPFPCTTYTPCSSDPIGPCSIAGNSVKIYYWPTQATQPLCPPNSTLFSTSHPTLGPKTAKTPMVKVIDGLTVTSPSIYISIPTLRGQFHGQPTYLLTGCGSQLTSLTLSIPPSPISTVTRIKGPRRPTFGSPSPFALETLNWPITTTSSCSEVQLCDWDEDISSCRDVYSTKCATPTVDPFHFDPILVLPTQLVSAAAKRDPGYQNCVVCSMDISWVKYLPTKIFRFILRPLGGRLGSPSRRLKEIQGILRDGRLLRRYRRLQSRQLICLR